MSRKRLLAIEDGIDAIRDRLDAPRQQGANPKSPSAWFLGPNAENEEALLSLAKTAISAHSKFRRDFQKGDPNFVSDGELQSEDHKETLNFIGARLDDILNELRSSIPLSSYRNQSHMYWDITLPGAVGYFAGLLYNQNNVAAEASPVTTALEISVGEDLCLMMGYDLNADIAPWGHITCDGSVANTEAMWSARNLRLLPVAAAAAITEDPELDIARNLTVITAKGARARVMELSPWDLINLPLGEALGLRDRIVQVSGLNREVVWDAIEARSVQALGLYEFRNRYLAQTLPGDPVVFVPSSAHYSWAKSGTLLGLGSSNIVEIPIDRDGRMDMVQLRAALDRCLAERKPVCQVVAVMGTTGEGSVDPLNDILTIRREYQEMGLSFAVHADAAWGGYFASLLHPSQDEPEPDLSLLEGRPLHQTPTMAFSPHVKAQFSSLGECDSITVDPHKAGFIPYPAGALCYRDHRMPELISVTSPVVFHGGKAPTVGSYGIEGSKPGAAAVGVALSHAAIPMDISGYGRILSQCIFNSKRFYAALVSKPDETAPYHVVPMNRLPIEKAGGTDVEIDEQVALLRDKIVPLSNSDLKDALLGDPDLLELFRGIGSDLTVTAYAFNFRTAAGINPDAALMDELNDMLFERMSLQIDQHGALPERELFVTGSTFTRDDHGSAFLKSFAGRAGLKCEPPSLKYLISTIQNPWITETSKGDFLPTLLDVLDRVVRGAVDDLVKRHELTPIENAGKS